jgi:hypothetical protein
VLRLTGAMPIDGGVPRLWMARLSGPSASRVAAASRMAMLPTPSISRTSDRLSSAVHRTHEERRPRTLVDHNPHETRGVVHTWPRPTPLAEDLPNRVTTPFTLVGNSADSRGLAQCRATVCCTLPNDHAQQPGPLGELHIPESEHAAPVGCSVLILMEAPSSADHHGRLALGIQPQEEEETS